MLKPDIPVWYRFLARYSMLFDRLFYDCQLGGPFLTPEEEADSMKRMWRDLLVKRADAVAELENDVWIIEVAADPGLRSLGQLFVYQSLWIRDPVINKPETLVLVCQTIEPDLLDAASMRSVQIYIV